MKILAFLQSPSDAVFPDAAPHVLDKYRDDQEYHRRMLRQSMTGNRLFQAFGEMYDQIYWDNVAPVKDVDQAHIDNVIVAVEPDVILTFGNIAKEAIDNSIGAIRIKVLHCHHPNARYKTQDDLNQFAVSVRNMAREFDLKKQWENDSK